MEQRIRVTVSDGVADVRLSRPDKMNALDQAMFDALVETGSSLARAQGLRAVVISGEGRAFCAGLDMGRFAQMAGAGGNTAAVELRLEARSHGIANAAQYAVLVWQDIPVPVIAAVHGVAFGGGFQLALGADIRFVAPDAKMSVMEIKWGLVPDMGGMLLMPRLARGDDPRADFLRPGIFRDRGAGAGFRHARLRRPLSRGARLRARSRRHEPACRARQQAADAGDAGRRRGRHSAR